MHPDLEELQAKLKEILYDCAVDIRATKAALYLYEQRDNRFELVTEYGFRNTIRPFADEKDPVVDRCIKVRTPFFVNGLMAEPRFSEILYDSATDRLLVSPLYLRGQLVGFVDMRDKAGKQPFEQTDLVKAQRVADRLVELFAAKNIFGQRFIQLSGTPEQPVFSGQYAPVSVPNGAAARPVTGSQPALRPVTGPHPVARPAPAPPALTPAPPAAAPAPAISELPRVATLILEARAAIEGDRLTTSESFTEAELPVARDILKLILLIPGVVAACFAASGHLGGGIQEISSRAPMGEDAIDALQARLNTWLNKRGEVTTFSRRNLLGPTGVNDRPLAPGDIQKVFTAPLNVASVRGLYLTVAFSAEPDRPAHDLLAAMHRQMQSSIEQSVSRRTASASRRRIAQSLLEPDFAKFPELRKHTDAVVARVDAFVKFLALSPPEIENARLVAMVHDVGMRLLDYDRLYRKRDLSHDELAILREHTVVGAAIVEPFLGPEIACAVLCHHERYDGGGYPNDLRGAEIPLLSRIVLICDVYEAMVAADNYQPPQTHDQAMTVIMRGAGSQLDAELAGRFVEMMRAAR